MNDYKLKSLITNLNEYNELVKQFTELCYKLETFEFKFSTDDNSIPFLVVKDISQQQLSQGSA
jgi:hypothetical protein